MKRLLAIVILLIMLSTGACAENRVNTLTYAVYPYLPDAGYYQEIIERRWRRPSGKRTRPRLTARMR